MYYLIVFIFGLLVGGAWGASHATIQIADRYCGSRGYSNDWEILPDWSIRCFIVLPADQ